MNDDRTTRPRQFTRREVARLGLGAAAAWTLAPWARRAEAEPELVLVTDVPANEPLLAGVQFVAVSARDDQRCSNCVLYRASAGDAQHGQCALFQQGKVPAEAWCISWGPKPS